MNISETTNQYNKFSENFLNSAENNKKEKDELLAQIKSNLNKLIKPAQTILKYLNKSQNDPNKITKLDWDHIEKIANVYNEIDTQMKETLLFDLSKCNGEKCLGQSKLNYLKNELNELGITSYLRLKSISNQFSLYKKYEHFEGNIDEEKLKESLEEERVFYVNKNRIKTRNFFINFQAHELEDQVYKPFFDKCGINSDSMIDMIKNKSGFFIPDELVYMFRSLSTNLIELNEENFDFMVFNTDMCWFVLFTNTNEDYQKYQKWMFKV